MLVDWLLYVRVGGFPVVFIGFVDLLLWLSDVAEVVAVGYVAFVYG